MASLCWRRAVAKRKRNFKNPGVFSSDNVLACACHSRNIRERAGFCDVMAAAVAGAAATAM